MIDLETVKKYLDITGTEDDEYLQQQIDSAEKMIESYCGREFDFVAGQTQMISDPERHLMLTRFPLAQIVSVTDDDSGSLIPESNYYFDSLSGWVRWNEVGQKWNGARRLTVEYDGGFVECPKDLEAVLLDMVGSRYYQKGQDIGRPVRQEKLDGIGQMTYAVDSSFFGGAGGFGNWPVHQYAGVLDLYKIETVTAA